VGHDRAAGTFFTHPIGMYARTVRKDDQTRRFTISDAGTTGWEVREEEDDQLLRRVVYHDWHRVERARMAFAAAMLAAGWVDA
jgi:hypothetical protein